MSAWQNYKAWVHETVKAKKDYYYRGQADARWGLKSTFHRFAEPIGISMTDYLNVIVPELHYQISAYHNEITRLDDPHEFGALLSLIQHNGFPTPLLDWTLSPYVAAYFAVRDIPSSAVGQTAQIFIFDYQEWVNSFEQILDFRNPKHFVSVIRPYAKFNNRIMQQRGAYTITNVSDVGAYLAAKSKEVNKTFLRTFTIPHSERVHVMRELNVMGINEAALFPGLEGICRTMREQFFSIDHQPSPYNSLLELLKKTEAKKNGGA